MTEYPYYHRLEIWVDGVPQVSILGSVATTIDGAARERTQIASQYHPNTLISISTHVRREPGHASL